MNIWKKWLRRTGIGVAVILGTLILLTGSALLFLRTEYAENWLQKTAVNAINTALSPSEQSFSLEKLGGSLPSELTLTNIQLADRQGVWLRIPSVELRLNLKSLLSYTVTLEKLLISSPQILRQPDLPAAQPSEPSQPANIPQLISENIFSGSMPKVDIQDISITDMQLAAPVLGAAMKLDSTLQASLTRDALLLNNTTTYASSPQADTAQFSSLPATGTTTSTTKDSTKISAQVTPAIQNIIANSAQFTLAATLDKNMLFSLSVALKDPNGVLVMLGEKAADAVPQTPSSLDLALEGKAPLEKWQGNFRLLVAEPQILADTAELNGSITLEPLSASLNLQASPTLEISSGKVSANIQAFFSGFANPITGAGAVAEQKIMLTAAVDTQNMQWTQQELDSFLGASQTLRLNTEIQLPNEKSDVPLKALLHKLTATAANFSLDGTASVASIKDEDMALKANFAADISSVSAFIPEFAAAIRATAEASGTLNAPVMAINISSPRLTRGNDPRQTLENFVLRLMSAPESGKSLNAAQQDIQLDLSADYGKEKVTLQGKAQLSPLLWNSVPSIPNAETTAGLPASADESATDIDPAQSDSPLAGSMSLTEKIVALQKELHTFAPQKLTNTTPQITLSELNIHGMGISLEGNAHAVWQETLTEIPPKQPTGSSESAESTLLSAHAEQTAQNFVRNINFSQAPLLSANLNGSITSIENLANLFNLPLTINNMPIRLSLQHDGQQQSIHVDIKADSLAFQDNIIKSLNFAVDSKNIWSNEPLDVHLSFADTTVAGGIYKNIQLSAQVNEFWESPSIKINSVLTAALPKEGMDIQELRVDVSGTDLLKTASAKGIASIAKARIAENTVDNANVEFKAAHIWNKPEMDIKFHADALSAAERHISPLNLQLSGQLEALNFSASAQGDITAKILAEIRLNLEKSSLALNLKELNFFAVQEKLGVKLAHPATLSASPEKFSSDKLQLNIQPAGALSLNGSLSQNSAQLTAILDKLPLNILPVDNAPHGELNAKINLSGTIDNPHGNLALNLSDFHYAETPPLSLELTGDLTPGKNSPRLALNLSLLDKEKFGADAAHLTANIPVLFNPVSIPENQPLSAKLNYTGKAAALWSFLPMADRFFSGSLAVDGTLAGTLATPKMQLSASLRDGKYEDLPLGILLTAMNSNIKLDEHGIAHLTFSCSDGSKGSANLDGTIILPLLAGESAAAAEKIHGISGSLLKNSGSSANLHASDIAQQLRQANALLDLAGKIDNLRPLHRSDIRISLSGDLKILGVAEQPDISGNITVNQGEIILDKFTGTSIPTLEISEEHTEQQKTKSIPLPSGNLNISVQIPRQFFVRASGLMTEWAGNLNVIGHLNDPAIAGSLNALRGTLDFLGKSFQLSRGVISFSGSTPISPLLDIALSYTSKQIEALIALTGTPSNLKLALTSTPSLPQDEILAQVLFGSSVSKLGDFEKLQLAAAAARLSGITSLDLMGSARSLLGVDVMRLGKGNDANNSLSLEVGKYVMDKVYMGVKQNLDSSDTEAIVEVEITPDINLSATAGTKETKVGVEWKYDY